MENFIICAVTRKYNDQEKSPFCVMKVVKFVLSPLLVILLKNQLQVILNFIAKQLFWEDQGYNEGLFLLLSYVVLDYNCE